MTRNALFVCGFFGLLVASISTANAVDLASLEKAAAQGDAKAINTLGESLMNGTHGKSDKSRACKLYEQAADKGYVRAMRNRANCALMGMTGPRDVEDAFIWLDKAIAAGDKRSYCVKGQVYYDGWLVKKDKDKALSLCRKALGSGAWGVELKYANMLFSSTMKNRLPILKEVEKWVRVAADRGEWAAKARLATILKGRPTNKAARAEYLALIKELANGGHTVSYIAMGHESAVIGFDRETETIMDEKKAEESCFWYSMAVMSGNNRFVNFAQYYGKPVCRSLPEDVRNRALDRADKKIATLNNKK